MTRRITRSEVRRGAAIIAVSERDALRKLAEARRRADAGESQ